MNKKDKIKIVSPEVMNGVVEARQPLGLYVSLEEVSECDDKLAIVACDNITGDAYVEDFNDLTAAVAWLRGETDAEMQPAEDTVAVSAEKVRQTLFKLQELDREANDPKAFHLRRYASGTAADIIRWALGALGLEVKEGTGNE